MKLTETQTLALSYASRILSATTGATEAASVDLIRKRPELLQSAFTALEDLEKALTPEVQPTTESTE